MLELQQQAPAFTTLNQRNETIGLNEYQGKKNIVLYFYPKDDTPGCTIEANQFTEYAAEFEKMDTIILGVSKDSCESHQNFIQKYKISFELLADESGELCESYDVWKEKEKNGIKKFGIVRSTFIINKEGVLVDLEYGVTPDGHAKNVLDKIKRMQ